MPTLGYSLIHAKPKYTKKNISKHNSHNSYLKTKLHEPPTPSIHNNVDNYGSDSEEENSIPVMSNSTSTAKRLPDQSQSNSNKAIEPMQSINTPESDWSQNFNHSNIFKKKEEDNTQINHLIEKMNNIILLLEENYDEKKGSVMEEVILYCFLGIFIIYLVDSFVKVGKYVR